MKIVTKPTGAKSTLLKDVPVSKCFLFNGDVYMRCQNMSYQDVKAVNLTTGLIRALKETTEVYPILFTELHISE